MMFRVLWNITHTLDEDSPLHCLSSGNCKHNILALVVLLHGTDQTYMQQVFATKCYYREDMLFERKFADMMTFSGNSLYVDMSLMNATLPCETQEDRNETDEKRISVTEASL